MHKFRRDEDHKFRVLQHADRIGDVGKAFRYFGVGRASFYRWRTAYRQHGLAGLENRKTAPKNPANRTAPEIVEKVLHLHKDSMPRGDDRRSPPAQGWVQGTRA